MGVIAFKSGRNDHAIGRNFIQRFCQIILSHENRVMGITNPCRISAPPESRKPLRVIVTSNQKASFHKKKPQPVPPSCTRGRGYLIHSFQLFTGWGSRRVGFTGRLIDSVAECCREFRYFSQNVALVGRPQTNRIHVLQRAEVAAPEVEREFPRLHKEIPNPVGIVLVRAVKFNRLFIRPAARIIESV